jgi:hypothetical protein
VDSDCHIVDTFSAAIGNLPAGYLREMTSTYVGNILVVSATRDASTNFNLIVAKANDVPVCARVSVSPLACKRVVNVMLCLRCLTYEAMERCLCKISMFMATA